MVSGSGPSRATACIGSGGLKGIAMRAFERATKLMFANRRRGVVSVLAMMFLVIFGSLSVALAVVSQGNLRTAATHIQVNSALAAAETGLSVAASRLASASARFVVERGQVDQGFGERIWDGAPESGDGQVRVMPPIGYAEQTTPRGIADALVNIHNADVNTVSISGVPEDAAKVSAPAGTDDDEYRDRNWVSTPAIALEGTTQDRENGAPLASPSAYQIVYAPLADGVTVRVFVTGYSSVSRDGSSFAYGAASAGEASRALTRTIQQDFRIAKRHRHGILSASRVLVGRNAMVNGNLGVTYNDVASTNGDPLVTRSDFYELDSTLDRKLNDFFTGVRARDVDSDSRLRVNHRTESLGIPSNALDYNNDGQADNAFADFTRDGYVDDYDIFLSHFDSNGDRRVTLSNALTAGTPAAGNTAEFTINEDLALLIDSCVPDRNRNQVSGFTDSNNNGRWDSGEAITDFDAITGMYPDVVAGWRNGVLDRNDPYAKVRGRLEFRATSQAWSLARGGANLSTYLQGSTVAAKGTAPTLFGRSADDLPSISDSSFTNSRNSMTNLADGQTFAQQVAAQLGIGTSDLATYVETKTDRSRPRYFNPATMTNAQARALTGQDLWEKMPFNSPQFTDWYIRPRYENMTFRNVRIPRGNNALFVNCTFIGVTHVQSIQGNTHQNWALYGRLEWNATQGRPVATTAPLDKSDFLRYTTGNIIDGPANYNDFPDPPVIDGQTRTGAARDTKLYSNNIRFHNSTFVGSLATDTPQVFENVRNKIQFTGSTRFSQKHPTSPSDPQMNPDSADLPEIAKSSLMAPNYSVDIGHFNSPTDAAVTAGLASAAQNVTLQGTIVAGVLDVRGTTTINGTLLTTYAPVRGEGPLVQYGQPVGNTANFNVSLGYFGPDDGDRESLDPATLPLVNGQRIVGWDLDGDGLPDLGPTQNPTAAQIAAGARAVPFYGMGRVALNWDPDAPMPDGIMLPLSAYPVLGTYKEGRK